MFCPKLTEYGGQSLIKQSSIIIVILIIIMYTYHMFNNVQQSINWFYLQSVSKHNNVLRLACRVSNILFTVIYC